MVWLYFTRVIGRFRVDKHSRSSVTRMFPPGPKAEPARTL